MSAVRATTAPVSHPDRFFIGGEWVRPSTDATIDVIDSGTEELYYSIAEAAAADVSRAVASARQAFDEGPWPRMSHAERAQFDPRSGAGLQERNDVLGQLWPWESRCPLQGRPVRGDGGAAIPRVIRHSWLTRSCSKRSAHRPRVAVFGLLVREPVGVVGGSSRGTRRWRSSATRSGRLSSPAAPSYSSPHLKHPARRTWLQKWRNRSGFHRVS